MILEKGFKIEDEKLYEIKSSTTTGDHLYVEYYADEYENVSKITARLFPSKK